MAATAASVDTLVLVLLLLNINAIVLPARAFDSCGAPADLIICLWNCARSTNADSSPGVRSAMDRRCRGAKGDVSGPTAVEDRAIGVHARISGVRLLKVVLGLRHLLIYFPVGLTVALQAVMVKYSFLMHQCLGSALVAVTLVVVMFEMISPCMQGPGWSMRVFQLDCCFRPSRNRYQYQPP